MNAVAEEMKSESEKEVSSIISYEGVGFRYGNESVLEDISLVIRSGDYVGVLGANGSGKTTLVKLALGLLRPTAGTIRLFGVPVEQFRKWEKVGYVPQHVFRTDQNFPATVREIVESGFGKDERQLSSDDQRVLFDRIVTEAKIGHVLDRRIGELSGGERQRAYIARALATRPELLILDEPTTGIDVQAERDFYGVLGHLNKSGMTIVLISHDLDAVAREVRSVICLNRRLVCFGAPDQLKHAETLGALYGDAKKALFHPHEH